MEITEILKAENRTNWRAWLAANHDRKTEIWVLIDYQPVDGQLTYLDSVEEAICFGWIDSTSKRYSKTEKAQRFSPRRKRSNWTELNKERARRLVRLGLMTNAGKAILPDLTINFSLAEDIETAIKSEDRAWETFESFPDLYKRVRIGYIEEMRHQPAEFKKRLRNFISKTTAGKMFGNWSDNGRLTENSNLSEPQT